MVELKEVEQQLKSAGCSIRYWGRAEMRELANLMMPGEKIKQCLNGHYEGGFAMLAATDIRVLLIDKKPLYLTLEDVRFDMIAEVDYNHNIFNATLRIFTPNQTVRFVGFNQTKMREFFSYIQQRVMEIRQHYMMASNDSQSMPVGPMVSQQQSQVAQPVFNGSASVQDQGVVNDDRASTQPASSTPQLSHLEVIMGGMRRVAPVISAYTHVPMTTRQRSFLGFGGLGSSRAQP